MAEITRARVGVLTRRLFELLAEAPEGLRAAEALSQLAQAVKPTPYEQSATPGTGVQRFNTIVRFATTECVKAGWMIKEKGRWTITDAGRKALAAYPDPEAFYREVVRLYWVWDASKRASTQSPDTHGTASVDVAEVAEKSTDSLPPYEFQNLVADLLKGMGYHVLWKASQGPDGGIDIIASLDPLGTRPPRIKVQVKRTADSANVDTVKAFVAVLGDEDVGIFVSAGGFTRDAERFARQQSKQHVTLVDLERLVELWTESSKKLDEAARRRLPLTPIYFLTPKE